MAKRSKRTLSSSPQARIPTTLSAQLGSTVPLETERGYHVMVGSPNIVPRIPVASGEGKYFVTAMEGGLRIAGTVELAGLHAPPNRRRADALLAKAQAAAARIAAGKDRAMDGTPAVVA